MKILDTDLLIAVLRGDPAAGRRLRETIAEAATTALNAAELYEGVAGSESAARRQAVDLLLAQLPLVPFGPRHARAYGPLSLRRRRSGLPGGVIDQLIASIAAAEGASVITRNVKDFEGHEGVRVESW